MAKQLLLIFLLLFGTDVVKAELPRYGTCNYLPDRPPPIWNGMFQSRFEGFGDMEELGIGLSYDHTDRSLSLYRFNMGYETIDESISDELFDSAIKDIYRRYKDELSDSVLEWSKHQLEPFDYFSKQAIVISRTTKGVMFDEFLSQGYTDKCLFKVRFTAKVVDTDSPYRYKDFFFHLEKLRKYFEMRSIITTLKSNMGTYVGETLFGVSYGQGIFTFTDGKRFTGEWKNGKLHGSGVITLPNGGRYAGDFKEGRPCNGTKDLNDQTLRRLASTGC